MNCIDALAGIGTARLATEWLRDRATRVVVNARLLVAAPDDRFRLTIVREDASIRYERFWLATKWTRSHQPGPRGFFARLRAPGLPPLRTMQDTMFEEVRRMIGTAEGVTP